MDPIKEAFAKAKSDIFELKHQIYSLSKEINELKSIIQQTNRQTNQQTVQQTTYNSSSTPYIKPTDKLNELENITLNGLKAPNPTISIGNRGVPTDRQTDKPTDRQTNNTFKKEEIGRLSEVLNSIDSIKEEVRFKFKKLTNQEMLVFSTIYQLEEENQLVGYNLLSKKLFLSESSIRDYTQKIIKKGIPLEKSKENNKKVFLSISKDLKKIAPLSSLLSIREKT